MNLDQAFKMAAKKFYEGTNIHQSSDKYSKRKFQYDLNTLDELKKKYVGKPQEEPEMEEESPEHELMPDDLEEDMMEEEELS